MANALTAYNPEYWAKLSQSLLDKMLVGKEIAKFEDGGILSDGDTFNKPYRSRPYVANYTKGSAVEIQDVTTTNEALDVDQSKIVPVYVDDVDAKQNKYDIANEMIKDNVHLLGREIDYKILSQVTNATLDIDDGDIGGTSGSPISVTASNATNVFGTTQAELAAGNVERNQPWYLVLDPNTINIVMQSFVANGFQTADASLRNGFIGEYLGFKVYESNSLLASLSINIATNPSDGDTVVLKGVTFEFKTAPSTAGQVDIAGSAAATVDNLVLAINGTGTPGSSTYIALSDEDRSTLKNNQVVAVDATTSVTVTAAGKINSSETFTDTTDNIGVQTIQCLSGKVGNISAVVQMTPTVKVKDVQDKLGKNYLTHTLYGVKTFREGARRMCSVNIQAAAATPVV